MSLQLPDCPVEDMRKFLSGMKWHPCPTPLEGCEYWFDKDDFNYVYFPCGVDPIPFIVITVIVNDIALYMPGFTLWDIPFYKGYKMKVEKR